MEPNPVWRFAGCEFDPLRRELRVRGAVADVEAKPLEVLHQLLLRAGEVVTKEELLEAVWPGLTVVDGSLATAVSKLRRALGDDDVIVTLPRIGYRIGVAVARGPVVPPAQATPQPAPTEASGRGRFLKPPALAAAAVIVSVAVGIGLYRTRTPGSAAAAPARITSLAVLPLVNMSGDPSQDYLADGMTEALIADLSKIRALRVISRTSVMRYKGVSKPVPEIARDLNVEGIVEGSVVRSGDRVRITAQLIDAATDAHLWSDSYERDLRDILNVQRELARRVSREIRITVQPSEDRELASAGAVNPKAHELYLKGRYFWNRRTRDDLNKSVEYFQQATAADPSYTEAYAGLADAYVELVGFGNIVPSVGIPNARAAALRAIELNDALAEPHAALAYGNAADWNWTAADAQFQRALELNPRYVVALYQYGFFLSMLGRQQEAVRFVRQALDLDPLSPIVLYRTGRVYFHGRQYDQAEEYFARIVELNPADPLGIYGLGLVNAARGRFDEAARYLDRQDLQRGFDAAAAHAGAGRTAVARRMLADRLKRGQTDNGYVRAGWVAETYAALGDRDEAFRWLDRAYAERDAWLALLKIWPAYDSLRTDPRFDDLLRRMNFPQ